MRTFGSFPDLLNLIFHFFLFSSFYLFTFSPFHLFTFSPFYFFTFLVVPSLMRMMLMPFGNLSFPICCPAML